MKFMKINLKEEVKTVRFKLYAFLCAFTIVIILFLILLNNLISENVYYVAKIGSLKNIFSTINEYYENADITEKDKQLLIRELEISNYIDICIENKNGVIKYNANTKLIEEISLAKKII